MVEDCIDETDFDIREALVHMLPRLRRFGFSLSRELDAADELVQDACERALDRVAQFQPGTRLDSWVFAIMHSIWKNRLRASAVRTGTGQVDLDLLADERSHRDAEVRVELALIDRLILELPEDQRVTLMMVSVEGASYREAADALGVPIGTVMSRVSRARASLAGGLAGSGAKEVVS